MPRCGEAFFFMLLLLRTLCRAAAKIFLCALLAKKLVPLCGEAFFFMLLLLRTLCRYAARHFTASQQANQVFADTPSQP
jgi:hypothetical protein